MLVVVGCGDVDVKDPLPDYLLRVHMGAPYLVPYFSANHRAVLLCITPHACEFRAQTLPTLSEYGWVVAVSVTELPTRVPQHPYYGHISGRREREGAAHQMPRNTVVHRCFVYW